MLQLCRRRLVANPDTYTRRAVGGEAHAGDGDTAVGYFSMEIALESAIPT